MNRLTRGWTRTEPMIMRATPRFALVIARLITAILCLLREDTRNTRNIGQIIGLREREPLPSPPSRRKGRSRSPRGISAAETIRSLRDIISSLICRSHLQLSPIDFDRGRISEPKYGNVEAKACKCQKLLSFGANGSRHRSAGIVPPFTIGTLYIHLD